MSIEREIIELADRIRALGSKLYTETQDWHTRSIVDLACQIGYHAAKRLDNQRG
jgi:hypothetical protein